MTYGIGLQRPAGADDSAVGHRWFAPPANLPVSRRDSNEAMSGLSPLPLKEQGTRELSRPQRFAQRCGQGLRVPDYF
jgi:hypothetical protein